MKPIIPTVFALLGLFVIFGWMCTPTEQTLSITFPNVIMVLGGGQDKIKPLNFANFEQEETDLTHIRGIYQYSHFYYHPRLDKITDFNARTGRVWTCLMWCSSKFKDGQVILIHEDKDKKNTWYVIDTEPAYLREEDVEGGMHTPVVYARSKSRSVVTYDVPWVGYTLPALEETKQRALEEKERKEKKEKEKRKKKKGKKGKKEEDEEVKKSTLPEVDIYLATGWHAFTMDNPMKIVSTIAVIGMTIYSFMQLRSDDDDFE